MKTKTYLIFDKENSHEYTILKYKDKDKNNIYEMQFSNNSEWSNHIKGQTIMFITEFDDLTFKIIYIDPTNFKNMQYSQLVYLNIITNFIFRKNKKLEHSYTKQK
jgi:hypothetical protein